MVVVYDRDGKDHDDTQQRVLQVCRQVYLKLNKDEYHFRSTKITFFAEIISRNGVKPDQQKLKAMMEVHPPKKKKQKQKQKRTPSIPWNNKLSQLFSPSTADVCEALKIADISQNRVDLECRL